LPENPELLILIHADLHAHNLLFQSGSNEPVILDWDNLVWALLNQDVSFSSHRLSRLAGKHTEDAFDIGVDWRTRMTAFLNEYTKILTITDEVREAIPFFLQDEYLTRILLILTYHFIDHRNDADPVLSDYMLLFNEALALEGQRI
jgi:Ser/Thr protein kinase RdoA (MazF antagonist)